MKKLFIVFILVLGLFLVGKSTYAAVKGTGFDPNNDWLGEITYLGNPAGYHFWFTPTESKAWYTEGHDYHNLYKMTVDDPSEWCGTVPVPDREPYNLTGHAGHTVFYKIIDLTTGEMVCPPAP